MQPAIMQGLLRRSGSLPLGEDRRILAGSLAYLGWMEEARAEAQKFLKDDPSFSTSNWASHTPFLLEKD